MTLSHTIENYLDERGAVYTVEHHAPTKSSLDTARNAQIDENALAKSVVLQDDRGFVLAVLPASRRLEIDRVRNKLGRGLRLSREYDMVRLFPDCAHGAIPPLGAAYGLPTVIDCGLENQSEVFFEGGDHETLVRMEGDQFLGLLATASVGEIASERASLTTALAGREKLHKALQSVRRAVGAPITAEALWRDRLRREVVRLAAATEEHIADTEAADSLLSEIENEAPRLWREVGLLRTEHAQLSEECAEMLARLDEPDSSARLRRRVHLMLEHFDTHRHRGADLVYQSFGVDIGGG